MRMVSVAIISLFGLFLGAVNCHIHDVYEPSDSGFLAGKPATVVQCALNSTYASENDGDCGRAEYMGRIAKIYEELITEESMITLPKISIVAGETDYSKLFADYIAKNKPALGHQSSPQYTSQQMAVSCGLDLSYPCPEIETFMIPRVAANNYLFRYSPIEVEKSEKTEDITSLWPSIFSIDSLDSPTVQMCDHDMHMVVWGASKSLRARVFSRSAAHHFKPYMGHSQTSDSNSSSLLHLISFNGSGFPKISMLQSTLNLNQPSKEVTKMKAKFAEVKLLEKESFLFIPNNHLVSFYPSGISEKYSDDIKVQMSLSAEERRAYLFKTCFVDASNLNKFKDALDLSSKVSQFDRTLLDQLMSGAISASMNRSAADTQLSTLKKEKIPIAEGITTVQIQQNKRTPNKRSTSSSSTYRDWQEENNWNRLITSLTLPKPYSPRVILIGRTNVTLTWESPFIPTLSDTTKFGFNMTLCQLVIEREMELSGILDIPKADRVSPHEVTGTELAIGTGTGCSVWTLVRGGPVLTQYSTNHDGAAVGVSTVTYSAVLHNLKPASAYHAHMTIFYDIAQSVSSERSVAFFTKPDTVPGSIPLSSTTHVLPILQTAVLKETKKKSKKKKQKSVAAVTQIADLITSVGGIRVTQGVSPSTVLLDFVKPYDDGGAPILGYYVWVRHESHAHFHQSWVSAGHYSCEGISLEGYSCRITVRDLLAKTSYSFRIQAYNGIGAATMSHSSEAVTTSSTVTASPSPSPSPSAPRGRALTDMRHTVYGRGHSLSAQYPASSSLEKNSILVTLDDEMQSLTVHQHAHALPLSDTQPDDTEASSRNTTEGETVYPAVIVDGWVSHYSPLLFSVTAECVWSSPPEVLSGEASIDNGDEIRGRIAVLLRGSVPIASKAMAVQHRGAVGAIVVDASTDCTSYDQICLPGADKSRGERFARLDLQSAWEHLKIPVIFLHREDAVTFLSAARLRPLPTLVPSH